MSMTMMKNSHGFPLMHKIHPATAPNDGPWIEHVVMDEAFVRHEKQMASWRPGSYQWIRGLEPGTYCVLKEGRGTTWMSDTWMERYTNAEALKAARGDVLVAGLGIGMVALAVANKPDVTSVTVLERDRQIVDLILPNLRSGKLHVVVCDAKRPPLRGRQFDAIWLDIWPAICADNWTTMKPMLAKYRRMLRRGGWIGAWLKDYVQIEARRR